MPELFSLTWTAHGPLQEGEGVLVTGFGAISPEEEAVSAREVKMSVKHFVWPQDDDQGIGIVDGDLTTEKKTAVEARAMEWLKSFAPAGTTDIFWRAAPEWKSEQSFETMMRRHRLYMRGMVWNRTDLLKQDV